MSTNNWPERMSDNGEEQRKIQFRPLNIKKTKKQKQNRRERDNVRGGKVHLTYLLWEPYAAELDFIFK